MRGSRPGNQMKPRRDDSELVAFEFDSTLGYPAKSHQFGSMERCSVCDLVPWRVSRGGDAGKCERCKNVRKRGTEMVKCRVCAWRKCTTCHNVETRGQTAPPPAEIRHPNHTDHDNEMPDQNDTAADDEMLHDDANLHILESLRELAKKNMPNTITFIPHRMTKRFARVYSSKLKEIASHKQREKKTR